MSVNVRNLTPLLADAAVAGHNKRRLDMLKLRAGLILHATTTTAVALADIAAGSTLAVQVAFVAECSAAYTTHIASACDATTGIGAHMAADATNVITTAAPTDLATCYARMNELKSLLNAHDALTTSHPVADATNTVTAPDADTAAKLATLGNQVKAKLNAHLAMAFSDPAIVIVAP